MLGLCWPPFPFRQFQSCNSIFRSSNGSVFVSKTTTWLLIFHFTILSYLTTYLNYRGQSTVSLIAFVYFPNMPRIFVPFHYDWRWFDLVLSPNWTQVMVWSHFAPKLLNWPHNNGLNWKKPVLRPPSLSLSLSYCQCSEDRKLDLCPGAK